MSEFQNLLHLGPYLRILANEIRQKISASHCFYNPWQRPISLGHFTNGATRMPSLISMTNGGSTSKPAERDCLHRRPPGALRHPQMTSPDPGTGPGMTMPKPFENQLG